MIRYIYTAAVLIFLFSSVNYTQVESEAYLEGASVTSIKQVNNDIWVSTYGRGIFRYSLKDNKWINYSTKQNNLENDLFWNMAASKDYVWAGSSEGLFIYDIKKDNWKKRRFAQGGEFGNWIRSLAYDEEKNILWIGRFRNLTHLDVKRGKYTDIDMTKNGDPGTNNILTVKVDGDSVVWFGTENGVHKYNKKKDLNDKAAWRYISNADGGFNGDGDAISVPGILSEKSNVWFGTDEFVTADQPGFNIGGIYKYDRVLRWQRISRREGLPANGISSMERTGNLIWAGVYSFDKELKKKYGKGIVLLDRVTGSVRVLDMNNTDISTSTINTMYFDGEWMWLGTDQGLWRIKISNPMAEFSAKKMKSVKK